MTEHINRASRRLAEKKTRNRKTGLAALTVVAATGLMSSYLPSMRGSAGFAFTVPESPTCFNIDVGPASSPSSITDLNSTLVTLAGSSGSRGTLRNTCVTITFPDATYDIDTPILVPEFFSGEGASPGQGTATDPEIYLLGSEGTRLFGDTGGYMDEVTRLLRTNETTFVDSISFEEGGADNGAAIYSTKNLTITNSDFIRNIATSYGGAIYADAGSVVTIENSSFTSNRAALEGGAIWTTTAGATVSNSSFTTNVSSSEGGAIFTSSDGLVITNSTFSSNSAARRGGAVWADDDLRVEGSTFTENSTLGGSGTGGAIFADDRARVSFSTFTSNSAFTGGGGLRADDDLELISSTFSRNSASSDGGALLADRGASITSSTFVENQAATFGGAVYSYAPIIELSTFVNNQATTTPDSADIGSFEGATLRGNIFASSTSASRRLWADSGLGPIMEYNLSTGAESIRGWDSTNKQVSWDELDLSQTLESNGGTTQTLALLSGTSAAVDFVPATLTFSTAAKFTISGTPRDQRSVERQGSFDAGAFEFGLAGAQTVSVPAPPFTVLDAKPINTQAGNIVQATGVNLTRVTEVYVNGIKVEITSRAGSSLSFIAPAGLTGLADVRFVGAGHEITLKAALNFAATAIAGDKVSTVVPGFRANSSKLTRPMKKAIREFVRANPELTTVTCKGFTSAPATPADLRLARQRGKATCDFIQKLNPELTVKVLKGSHTNTPGQQIRRVRIVME